MGWWAAAGAAASDLGSNLLNNYMSRRNTAEQHDWAVEDAQTDRNWQEKMSNSAHQREVADLRAAGLNPILSGTGGGGAPTGSGSTADSSVADVHDNKFISSALEASLMTAQKKLIKAQEENAASSSELLKAQARKTDKESAILSPKATIFEKLNEGIQWGAKQVDAAAEGIRLSDPKAKSKPVNIPRRK